jgi:hypothetical protein
VRGNLQALFGKRLTEKGPAKGTSPAVDFTLRGLRRGNAPELPDSCQQRAVVSAHDMGPPTPDGRRKQGPAGQR